MLQFTESLNVYFVYPRHDNCSYFSLPVVCGHNFHWDYPVIFPTLTITAWIFGIFASLKKNHSAKNWPVRYRCLSYKCSLADILYEEARWRVSIVPLRGLATIIREQTKPREAMPDCASGSHCPVLPGDVLHQSPAGPQPRGRGS